MLLPGQRELHFKREKEPRQRRLVAAMSRLQVDVHIYLLTCERKEEFVRQACVSRLARDLLERGAHRLVLDSRDQLDTKDEATIRAVVAHHPHHTRFVYEHVDSTSEPLVWIADAAAWCFGAGGHWRRQIEPVVAAVVDLDDPR
jgi:hypothetical protein